VDDLGHIQEKLDEIRRSQRWGEIRGELVKFAKLALAELTARTPSLGKEPARADFDDTESCNGESRAEPRGQFVDPIPQSAAELIAWLAKRAGWFRAWYENPKAQLDAEYLKELIGLFPPTNLAPLDRDPAIQQLQSDQQAWAREHQYLYIRRLLFEVHRLLDEWGISGHPNWKNGSHDEMWFHRANDYLSHLLNYLRTSEASFACPECQGVLPAKYRILSDVVCPHCQHARCKTGRFVLPVASPDSNIPATVIAVAAPHWLPIPPNEWPEQPIAADKSGPTRPRQAKPGEPVRPKRSTEKGEARAKLIAALTKHHQYANGSCLNLESIGNNELARQARVAKRSASSFFKKEFHGHIKYRKLCSDQRLLVAALKSLNNEFRPHNFYDARKPDEVEREGD
jgi:hypothetical protein